MLGETRRLYIVAFLCSCTTTATASTCDDPVAFPHTVDFGLGEIEFYGNDEIEIDEIRGTLSRLEPGGSYQIKGTYLLTTKPSATMLLSATTTRPDDKGLSQVRRLQVSRGQGSYQFDFSLAGDGYLHLTFYDVGSGRPFGGVYFGQGRGVLRKKGWSYERPL